MECNETEVEKDDDRQYNSCNKSNLNTNDIVYNSNKINTLYDKKLINKTSINNNTKSTIYENNKYNKEPYILLQEKRIGGLVYSMQKLPRDIPNGQTIPEENIKKNEEYIQNMNKIERINIFNTIKEGPYIPIYIENVDGISLISKKKYKKIKQLPSFILSCNKTKRIELPYERIQKQVKQDGNKTNWYNLYAFSPRIINIKQSSMHAVTRAVYQQYLEQYYQDSTDINRYDWNIAWIDRYNIDFLCTLKRYQKINYIPGIEQLSKKRNLVRIVHHMPDTLAPYYTFIPNSWDLPRLQNEFIKYHKDITIKKSPTYIIKPGASCQGSGIYLLQDPQEYLTSNTISINCVISTYIDKPLQINGLKFDLRIYVQITSTEPLRVYIFEEGFARFCTEKYEYPNKDNLKNIYSHLTNYTINKYNAKADNKDDVIGSKDDENKENMNDNDNIDNNNTNTNDIKKETKQNALKWSFSKLNEYLCKEYGYEKVVNIWDNIHEIIIKTIQLTVPVMRVTYNTIFKNNDTGKGHCFQLIGFDIMIDENLKPWQIEVNRNPALHCDTEIDQLVKTMMIGQLFLLIDPQNSVRPTNIKYGKTIYEDILKKNFYNDINDLPYSKMEFEIQYRQYYEDMMISLLQAITKYNQYIDIKINNTINNPVKDASIKYQNTTTKFTNILYSGQIPYYTNNWYRQYPHTTGTDYIYPSKEYIPQNFLELINEGRDKNLLPDSITYNNLLQVQPIQTRVCMEKDHDLQYNSQINDIEKYNSTFNVLLLKESIPLYIGQNRSQSRTAQNNNRKNIKAIQKSQILSSTPSSPSSPSSSTTNSTIIIGDESSDINCRDIHHHLILK